MSASRPAASGFPADLRAYSRTKSFTPETMPAKIGAAHDTKPGVWGRLVVEEGAVVFTDCRWPDAPKRLAVGEHDVIEPEMEHFVTPEPGSVFHVVFLRPA